MELAIFQIVIPFATAVGDVGETWKSNLMDLAISRNVTHFVMAMENVVETRKGNLMDHALSKNVSHFVQNNINELKICITYPNDSNIARANYYFLGHEMRELFEI